MSPQPAYLSVKFGVDVWHDESYDGKPADFFDREQEKRLALDLLSSEEGQQVIWLIGERRAGKTSVLHLLLEKCRQKEMKAFEIPWTVIYSPSDFYREYLNELDKVLNLPSGIRKRANDLSDEGSFLQALDDRQPYYAGQVLVIGLDEIDSILAGMDVLSAKTFAGILKRLSRQNRLILTSVKGTDVWREYASSIEAQTISLPPFSRDALFEMIKSLAPEEQPVHEQIYEFSGGWPYYAKAILYHLLQIPPETPERLERAIQAAAREIAPTCEHLYQHHWDEDERRVLLLLARQGTISLQAVEALGAKGSVAFRELVERGYLFGDEKGYRFRVRLIERWFQEWSKRELEEEKLNQGAWLQAVALLKEDGEKEIRVSRGELDQAGF